MNDSDSQAISLLPEILTAIALLFFYYNFDAAMRSLGLDPLVGLFKGTDLGLLIGHVLITLPFVFLGISSSLYNFDRSLEDEQRTRCWIGKRISTAFCRRD